MATVQNDVLFVPEGVVIDESHDMEFAPCLHLECSKCFLSVRSNASELAEGCVEDIHEINDARITQPLMRD